MTTVRALVGMQNLDFGASLGRANGFGACVLEFHASIRERMKSTRGLELQGRHWRAHVRQAASGEAHRATSNMDVYSISLMTFLRIPICLAGYLPHPIFVISVEPRRRMEHHLPGCLI